jgi:hypothetical protein
MSLNQDFRLRVGALSHPKIKKLKRTLGAEGVLAWIALLAHAASYHVDGCLHITCSGDLAIAADWDGPEAELWDALIGLRLLDKDPHTGLVIHDWTDHNPWAAEALKRSEAARKANEVRWSKARAQAPEVESGTLNIRPGVRSDDIRTPEARESESESAPKPAAAESPLPILSSPSLASPVPALPSLSPPPPTHVYAPTRTHATSRDAAPEEKPEDASRPSGAVEPVAGPALGEASAQPTQGEELVPPAGSPNVLPFVRRPLPIAGLLALSTAELEALCESGAAKAALWEGQGTHSPEDWLILLAGECLRLGVRAVSPRKVMLELEHRETVAVSDLVIAGLRDHVRGIPA